MVIFHSYVSLPEGTIWTQTYQVKQLFSGGQLVPSTAQWRRLGPTTSCHELGGVGDGER